jgi:pimeloyl-ACP methyl ester carboxylesterase
MRRIVAGLLVLALVVGVLAAVGLLLRDRGSADAYPDYEPATPTAAAGVAPATTPPDLALASFYDQDLAWQSCGDGFECATASVPLDYADPAGTAIDLNLLKRPADDQDHKVGSLLVNPGGPGAPGTPEAQQAEFYFRQPLLTYFDIVGVDPRGTGASDPVDCLSDADLDGYLSADPEPQTPQEERDYLAEVQALGRGCVSHSGELASHISTIEAARDLDVLRAALGDQTMNYFGSSYGTELGATYAELFPTRVGRFVLDGAVDPTLGPRESALSQAQGFETALRAYVANCVDTSSSCFLGASVDEGIATIQGFLDDVETNPLPTGDDARPLTLGLAVYGIITPLYQRSYWVLLSSALRAALGGDGSQLLRFADLYAHRNPDGSYADNFMEAFPAISCLDAPSGISPSAVPAEIPAFEKASPTFGPIFAWGLVGCRDWPAHSTEKPITIDADGAAPIVVIGTTRDPATPLAEAQALASQLASGVLITRDGDGHTGYNSDNDCVDIAVESYLIEGKVPADDLSC